MRQLFEVGICAVLVCILRAFAVESSIIASSRIETCHRTAGSSAQCRPRLTVSLTVGTGEDFAAETILLPNATDDAGRVHSLVRPLKVSLRKLPTVAQYPVVYLQNVNEQPYEAQHRCNVHNCDSLVSTNCRGSGFCCRCPLWSTSGISKKKKTLRGTLKCDFFSAASALVSCMHLNTSWYEVYDVLEPQLVHSVEVVVNASNISSENTATVGTVTPEVRMKDVHVAYHADFSSSWSAPSFRGMHFIRARTGGKEAMLDKSYFSLDGSQCNKIGVSMSAFSTQPSRCGADSGACLQNQIPDVERQALQRRAEGRQSSYFMSDYGDYEGLELSHKIVSYRLPPQRLVSLVTLTAESEDLVYVLGVIHVRVVEASVTSSSRKEANGRVVLRVEVVNLDDVVGSITFSCNTNSTATFPAVTTTLQPNETSTVYMEGVAPMGGGNGSHMCHLEIANPVGVVATELISWTMDGVAHQHRQGTEGQKSMNPVMVPMQNALKGLSRIERVIVLVAVIWVVGMCFKRVMQCCCCCGGCGNGNTGGAK